MAPPKKKSKNVVDPTWNHCVRATELIDPEAIDNTRLKLVCNYCGKTLSGCVSRMKHHLAHTHHNAKPCEKVSKDVTNMFLKILGVLKQRNCIEQHDVDCFDEVGNMISKRGNIGRLPVHHDTITKAKTLTVYIYRHTWVLNLMRKHKKNHNLARPVVTSFKFNVHFKFYYDASFEADEEVRLGLYTVIERMYPGIQARLKLDAQMDKFHNAAGMFGIDMAVITREK
ncbi:hypothetical protein RHSIM_Rhsim04G0154100 [Rhododendron simsii]|uniref:BED-type domain-containing protein n=1 Tax=Rhododendron simsii TaxID=118357 RepID=A0A834H3C7_RHOSS|nr:hypothetical protein RHSIM_Rhsim04G0154100 [Rhododendron simsii]